MECLSDSLNRVCMFFRVLLASKKPFAYVFPYDVIVSTEAILLVHIDASSPKVPVYTDVYTDHLRCGFTVVVVKFVVTIL
jgi:hypothetical protein